MYIVVYSVGINICVTPRDTEEAAVLFKTFLLEKWGAQHARTYSVKELNIV